MTSRSDTGQTLLPWQLPRSLRLTLGAVFMALAVWFMWAAFREGQGRLGDVVLPGVGLLFASGAAVVAALAVWTWLWCHLLGVRLSIVRARDFVVGLLGKYIPGGVWAPGAHFVVGARAGAPARALHAVVSQSIGGVLGALVWLVPVVAGTSWPIEARLLAALAVIVGWASWVFVDIVAWCLRLLDRNRAAAESTRRSRTVILLASAAVFGLHGLGFALLLPGAPADLVIPAGAHAVAWAVGYVAVPFPAGIGVREAVLIVVLGGRHAQDDLVVAAVLFRLVTLVAEALLGAVLGLSHRLSTGQQ